MFRSGVYIAVSWIILSAVGQCCSCLGFTKPCQRMAADFAIVGHVSEIIPAKHSFAGEFSGFSGGYSMHLIVEESLLGEVASDVQVETGNGGGDCGTPLPVGRRFIIFANKGKDGMLWTGLCNGNIELKGDDKERLLDQYEALAKKGGGSIFGRVSRAKELPHGDVGVDSALANVLVKATSEAFTATTKTTADGWFEFGWLPAGKYSVDLVPTRVLVLGQTSDDQYHPNITGGRCVKIGFLIRPGPDAPPQ
jgi:hypothetical protein